MREQEPSSTSIFFMRKANVLYLFSRISNLFSMCPKHGNIRNMEEPNCCGNLPLQARVTNISKGLQRIGVSVFLLMSYTIFGTKEQSSQHSERFPLLIRMMKV